MATSRQGDHPQAGRPRGYVFSIPILSYLKATQDRPVEYRARLWQLSERLVAPFASSHSWPAAF